MWTRGFMRTAVIFLVTMTALAQQPAGNAETWVKLDGGVNKDWISVLAAGENRLYAGTEYGILVSDDQGLTWRYVPLGFKHSPSSMAVDGNTVYVGTFDGGIFRSDDSGETWKPIRNGLITYKIDEGDEPYWGMMRQILVRFNEVIAVAYHSGTYVSTDEGETWQNMEEWTLIGGGIWSMTEFEGNLWCMYSSNPVFRSFDDGKTWEGLPWLEYGRVTDWAALYNRLYVSAEVGIGRWNELTRGWEYPMNGLPDSARPNRLAVLDGHLYAGMSTLDEIRGGVYVFDPDTEKWSPVGLDGFSINALLSHDSILYAGTSENGIYAATPQRVHPNAKAVTTWGRVKQGPLAKD